MRRSRLPLLLIVILTVALSVSVVSAQSGTLTDDAFTDAAGNGIDGNIIALGSQNSGAGCTVSSTGWFQFSLSGHVTGADFTVSLEGGSMPNPADVVLYAASEGWTEEGLAAATDPVPTLGSELDRLVGWTATSGDLVFDSAGLDSYLDAESGASGDDIVAFGVQIENCPATANYALTLDTKEDADGTQPELANPTVVSLRSVEATSSSNSTVIIGIMVLGLVVLAMAAIIVRQRSEMS